MIVSLWSGPRNLSTALMYFFAHRGDFKVLDEPFFGAFLKEFEVWRPSRKLALKQMELDPRIIHQQIVLESKGSPLFLKNMANHLPIIDENSTKTWKHIIQYRHPAAVIQSYRKQMNEISLFDLAYKEQVEWIKRLKERGEDYYLLDSHRLQQDPETELQKLCDWLQIPFRSQMLSWPSGAIPEDGVWAPWWYDTVHQSTGFEARPVNTEYPQDILEDPLFQNCLPYYEYLKTAHDEQVQFAGSPQ